MNKTFKELTYFEIHYNAQMDEINIVWMENGQKKGEHRPIEGFHCGVPTEGAKFKERPRFRMVGECKSITTSGGKTVIS